jgi:hypothetical protein
LILVEGLNLFLWSSSGRSASKRAAFSKADRLTCKEQLIALSLAPLYGIVNVGVMEDLDHAAEMAQKHTAAFNSHQPPGKIFCERNT